MKLLALVAAVSLAFAVGCDRNTSTTPSPKTDTSSSAPSAAAGSTTGSSSVPANTAAPGATAPSAAEKREGRNPQQGQVDPKQAEQHRDFQQRGDQAGPQSSDAKPTMKN